MNQLAKGQATRDKVVGIPQAETNPQFIADVRPGKVSLGHGAQCADEVIEYIGREVGILIECNPVLSLAIILIPQGRQVFDQGARIDESTIWNRCIGVQCAVHWSLITAQVNLEQALPGLWVFQANIFAPILKPAKNGGQVALAQLIGLAACQNEGAQIGIGNAAPARQFIHHGKIGQLLPLCQRV